MSCIKTLKYSSVNFCIEINCFNAFINLYHCNKQFYFHTYTAHFRCRLQKRYPGTDKIIRNTNNRCRTLFKCQIGSGDWGKYNLIIMLQNSATFMASFGLHEILPFYYSAGNTITFMPCILEEEHFLIQQVTPQKYCH